MSVVFMDLAGDRGLEVVSGPADGQAGGRIADRFEELEMPVGVAGLALGGRAEYGGDVVVTFHVGLLSEVEVAAVGLGFPGEGGFQVFFGRAVLERCPSS
jgi:hypothetical protein